MSSGHDRLATCLLPHKHTLTVTDSCGASDTAAHALQACRGAIIVAWYAEASLCCAASCAGQQHVQGSIMCHANGPATVHFKDTWAAQHCGRSATRCTAQKLVHRHAHLSLRSVHPETSAQCGLIPPASSAAAHETPQPATVKCAGHLNSLITEHKIPLNEFVGRSEQADLGLYGIHWKG